MKKSVVYIVFLLCLLVAQAVTAQQAYLSGLTEPDKKLSPVPSSRVFPAPMSGCAILSGIINTYTAVTQISAGRTSINVSDASHFSKDDQVLFVQMQGAQIDTSPTDKHGTIIKRAGAGNYEYAIINEINGNTISFTQPLSNRVYRVEGKIQLIRVPEYNKAIVRGELTCPPWDGTTGGILAFSANCLRLEGHINVAGKGFRGGGYRINPCNEQENSSIYATTDPCFSAKGEGVAGFGMNGNIYGRGAVANGGGGGNPHNGGGGGGGSINGAGKGGDGYALMPDAQLSGGLGAKTRPPPDPGPWDPEASNINILFLGGGGGAGHSNDGHGSGGGNGGGIVIIRAGTIINTDSNSINVNGESALDDHDTENPDGCGGGGGAGTILLDTRKYVNLLFTYALGGNGGSRMGSTVGHGTGGGGSGGYFVYDRLSDRKGKLSVDNRGGNAGTALEGGTYGAQPGFRGPAYEAITVVEGNVKLLNNAGCESCAPVIQVAENQCHSTPFTIRDTIYAVQEIVLDPYQSFNTRLQLSTLLPSNHTVGVISLVDSTKPGMYVLQGTNADGGTSTYVGQLYPSLTPLIEVKGNELVVVNSKPGDLFQWYKNGLPIPDGTKNTYTAHALSEYFVEVSTIFGCKDTSAIVVISIVGVESSDEQRPAWIIGPNPASELVLIEATGDVHGNVSVEITTILGTVLWNNTWYGHNGNFSKEIDMGNYPPGVYYLTIYHGLQRSSFKVIKL